LGVVLSEFGSEGLEDFVFVGLILVNFHEIFDALQVIEHRDTIVHYFFLALADCLKLSECIFDC